MIKAAALLRATVWLQVAPRFLPFADAATAQLPLLRLFRLSLFQVSVGMASALLVGTLNRVMIVEMGVSAWLVSLMVALPLVFAPFRALVGFRSDTHRSVLGWKRVPYIWLGTWLQFGGLAIMPFALFLLSGDITNGPEWLGHASAALAFLLVGAGMQTTQTAGLALATDLAPESSRPRVVALMYVMLLLGMVVSGLVFGAILANFTPRRLIGVVQGAATLTMALNLIALWKQEPRNPKATAPSLPRPLFSESWKAFMAQGRTLRFLAGVGCGTAAFSMQDIILEPYGGEILGLSVAATTILTALLAGGALAAFSLAARWLSQGADAHRLSAYGVLAGIVAFVAVILSAPLESPWLFRLGTVIIGFGGGLFAVSTLTAAMGLDRPGQIGLALGAWGAVQATAAGVSIALGGAIRDGVSSLASQGLLGPTLTDPVIGYSVVYQIEIALLFIALVIVGPLVGKTGQRSAPKTQRFGLAEFPG
jgi:BCD family chlorophyll transporter-like MFS transporter